MYISNINLNNTSFTGKSSKALSKKAGVTMKELATKLIEEEKKRLDVDKDILSALLKGFSIREISEKMGVTLYRVNEISAKYKAHKIYIQRRNDIILEKLLKGVPRKTIMKEMDISKRTIQFVAEANNAFNEKIKNRDGLILEKIKSGMYGKDIAKELGINEATVWRTAQKYGLTVRELRKLAKD